MTFSDYSKNTRELISENFKKFYSEKKEESLPVIFKQQRMVESLEEFSLRGKLIRGTLFLFMSQAMGLKIEKKLVDVACSIELIHSSLLIQDDIIDNDELRRGAPTIFAKYQKDGEELQAFDPYHYGISTALVVADIAFFYAMELLSKSNEKGTLLEKLSREIYYVVLAESADSIFGQTNTEPTEEDIYAVYKYKTARYTFSLPFEMACIVADKEELQEKLSEMGEQLGIIFQLKDDEIGLFGDEEKIGKPVGSDIRENKKTLIRHLLYEAVNDEDKKILSTCFGNSSAGIEELQIVKKLYEEYGIKKQIDNRIEVIMKDVRRLCEELPFSTEYKEIFNNFLEFNLSRTS